MSIKSNKGTTLVELMVSIAIFGIIASAAMGLLLYATNINSNVTADSVESGRVYQVLDFVKQTVAESSSLGKNDDGKSFQVEAGKFIWNDTQKTLVFENGSNNTVLLENVTSFIIDAPELVGEGPIKYLTFKFTTDTGNEYELTVTCRNG